MKIKEITYKSGRDYWAIFICENCGHEEKDRGYDDDNYRENVIPNIRCHICDKSTNDLRQSMDTINEQPTIDPVKHGRWEMDTDPDDGDCRCSSCRRCIDALHRRNHARLAALGYELNTFYKFCPSCGAKMDEPKLVDSHQVKMDGEAHE